MHIQPHSQPHSSRKFSWILKERLWLFPSLGYIFHVLRVFSRNVFLQGLFFLCFWRNVYRSALVPHPPALKNIWLCTATQALFFAKQSILNVFTVFWTHIFWELYGDFVLCTASDTFSIIMAYSTLCFSGILDKF